MMVACMWLTWVLAYLRVLVWPLALILLVFFNKPVRNILNRLSDRIKDLRSVSAFGVQGEFDFDRSMVQARKALEEATSPPPSSEASPDDDAATEKVAPTWTRRPTADIRGWTGRSLPTPDVVAEYAQNSPQTTIVSAWQTLDATVRMLYRKLGLARLPDGAGVVTETAALAAELAERGVLDNQDSILLAVTELAYLRRSVEQRVVTKLEAFDFADTALQVSKLLTEAYERIPARDRPGFPERLGSAAHQARPASSQNKRV